MPLSKAAVARAAVTLALARYHAELSGQALRGPEGTLPTDNFWYAWLLAALARGVVRNETGDGFTAELADMTLREIAALADTDPSFYDT